jgi:hypothetical protein
MNVKIAHSLYKKLLLHYQDREQKQREFEDNAFVEAKKLAQILATEFGVTGVYLFGPLTYRKLSEGMKIDLAVEGVSPETFARALGRLSQISAYGVELTDIRRADSWTKRSILETGMLLVKKER